MDRTLKGCGVGGAFQPGVALAGARLTPGYYPVTPPGWYFAQAVQPAPHDWTKGIAYLSCIDILFKTKIVGAPLQPTDERFREVYNTVAAYVEDRYGIPVVISDVVNPFTGDLDGSEIHVDYENSIEEAVFILVHLFGHTVQWNMSDYNRKIGYEVQQNPSLERIDELERYEKEACGYSLQLFHDAGVRDLDQWTSDYAACDFAFLRTFYLTGKKSRFRSFWKDGQPLLKPLPIPDFVPTKWISRWQGIVVGE